MTIAGCNPSPTHQSAAPDAKQLEAALHRDRESAQKSINDIEAAVSATSVDSEKYQPKRLRKVQDEVSMLKAQLEQGEYEKVLGMAPLVMNLVGIVARGTVIMKRQATEIAPSSSYHVFAALDHRGTHYELSDEPVPTCVHLEGEDRWDWKLAWIEGRWMGTVKSCWYKAHREEERVNIEPGTKGAVVTVPAHDEIVICLPYAQEKGSHQRNGPACQNIDPAYFIAVESLPHSAF